MSEKCLGMGVAVGAAKWEGILRQSHGETVGKVLKSANLYHYTFNNPVNFIDPWGLWYLDYNGSVHLRYGVGVTFGVMINNDGMYPYLGFGFTAPPGGGSATWSSSDPSLGWNAGLQLGYWLGGQIGYAFSEDLWFAEGGLVSPGGSLTAYYVFAPIEIPRKPLESAKCH